MPTAPNRAKDLNQLIISYRLLQRLLGLLGLALPLALLLFTWIEGRPLEPSISDFYYTKMGGFFVGTLCAVGVFLFCYNGFPNRHAKPTFVQRLWTDRTFAIAGGTFAICVALFPVKRAGLEPASFIDPATGLKTIVNFGATGYGDWVHYTSAILFFTCIFIFSAVFFPRGEAGLTLRKIVYYICGGVMAAAILRMAPYFFAAEKTAFGPSFLFTWESVAIFAFSVAWLAKGKIDEPLSAGLSRLMRRR